MRQRGSIKQIGKDKWRVRVTLDTHRHTKSETVYGKRADAERRHTQLLALADAGKLRPTVRVTVGQYLDQWLDGHARITVRPSTFRRYADEVERYIKPGLGKLKLESLSRAVIKKFLGDLRSGCKMAPSGLAHTYVDHVRHVLSSALSEAVESGLIDSNPALGIRLRREAKFEPPVLSAEEGRRLIQELLPRPNGLYVVTLMLTGMRPGEGLELRWKDIDFVGQAISVRRAYSDKARREELRRAGALEDARNAEPTSANRTPARRGSHEPGVGEPKSAQATRPIPIVPELKDLLLAHRNASRDTSPNALVFSNRKGRHLELGNVASRTLKPALAAAGLPKSFRLYDTRHFFATMLTPHHSPKVLQALLGHSSTRLTMDTYAHVVQRETNAAAATISSLLFSGARDGAAWPALGESLAERSPDTGAASRPS